MDLNTVAFMFEEQLKTFRGYRGKRRHLCYWNHGFACLEEDHTTEPHPVLMRLNSYHYDKGLTVIEWTRLLGSAIRAWENDHKCHQPQKL